MLISSAAEFKARQRLDYAMNVQELPKEDKRRFTEECEATVMNFFFENQGKELKASSPAKRVEAATKALQKMVTITSRVPEIESDPRLSSRR